MLEDEDLHTALERMLAHATREIVHHVTSKARARNILTPPPRNVPTPRQGSSRSMTASDSRARIAGCLLGGAVGDALGASVEFRSLSEIRRTYGARGILEFAPAYGRLGAITDDTQMTLFTAEGVIRASVRLHSRGICHPPSVISVDTKKS